ncbi:hypothetical protein AOQ84DRAFT_318562 [Glonium stellatum]|uniref:Uncharacterized protein n=1 Tax=Glonium stellatum TaxID=574774 RepID=A0A8E2JT00_9PEZI|nr:hypothetical protein AOQ84DRAFT_318562 [Glonium stellatum]
MHISAPSPLAELGFVPFAWLFLRVMVIILKYLVSLVTAVRWIFVLLERSESLRSRELDEWLN